MLLSADSLTITFAKIYCYWTRTVGVIAKGSRGPVFFETQCINEFTNNDNVHMNMESVQCISIVYSIYVCINIISELFRLVEKNQTV